MSKSPRFSVVIPTRNRADTLRVTLATCLEQQFDDYEIIVCDNCSPPATKAVVDHFASPRISYVRSEVPLAMVENWNLAYEHARGEFVIYLGDDDGLMPYALGELDRLFRRHDVRAIRWNWAVYTWPDVALEGMADYLKVCLTREARFLHSHEAIADAIDGRALPDVLPNVYHSAVSRELLEQLRDVTGTVFAGFYPDTYTSFAVAYLLDRHLSITVPMTVIGVSGASTGVSALFLRGKHPVAGEFRDANARIGVQVHPWVPDLPLLPCVVADSFLTAKAAVFPEDERLTLDRRQLAERCASAMPADTAAEQRSVLKTIRDSLSDDPALVSWFDDRYEDKLPAPLEPPLALRPTRLGFDGESIHLDAAAFDVHDIGAAVQLTNALLGFDGAPIRYEREGPHETNSRGLAERSRRAVHSGLVRAAARLKRAQ